MKNIIIIIFSFVFFYSYTAAEEILAGGNETVLYGFDISAMKIVSVKNKYDLSTVLNGVEIGYFIDDKPVRVIEMNPKAEYILGTSIIKIESSYQKIKITTYILSPSEENRDSIFIVSNIKNSDGKNSKNIKSFFILDTTHSKSSIKFDRVKNSFLEEECSIRALNSDFSLYFTSEKDYKELKLRKSRNSEDEKKEGEQLFFVSETGEVERYGEKRDIVEISVSGGEKYSQEEDIKSENIVDREIGIWDYWHGNISKYEISEKEKKILKQCMVFLKLSQMKDGSILPSLLKEYEYIKSEEMLLAALAFIKTEHFDEAKKILEYISTNSVKNGNKISADYGYEIGKNSCEKKIVRGDGEVYSYYTAALYLYVFSEYINESGDIALLKKEYMKAKKQADFLLSKIKERIIEPDCYIGEIGSDAADSYLNTTFFAIKAFSGFFAAADFYIPLKEIKKYREGAEILKSGITEKFIKDGIIIDSIKSEEIKLRNSFIFEDKLFKEEERKKTFEKYKEIYTANIKEDKGREEIAENIFFIAAAFLNKEKNSYLEALERVNNIITANGYIIPEYIKTEEKTKKYGAKGIDIKINAVYILMRKIGGDNGFNE